MLARRASLVSLLAAAAWLASASPAAAFCEEAEPFCTTYPDVCNLIDRPYCHREITEFALPFLRPYLLERIVHTNLHIDHEHYFSQSHHFDGCDFQSAGHRINELYSSEVDSDTFLGLCLPVDADCEGGFSFLFPHFSCGISIHCDAAHRDTQGVVGLLNPSDPRPIDASGVFGYLLHPTQDFYSHSNWVEIFESIGVHEAPLMEPTVDLWGTQPWNPLPVPAEHLAALGVDGVVLAEEALLFDPPFSGTVLNPLVQVDSELYSAVVSDINVAEDECVSGTSAGHSILNKDSPKMHDFYHPDPEWHFRAARAAVRQTAHEWCRLLHLAREHSGFGAVSTAMGFLVSPDAPVRGNGSPHPPGTPCAATPPGGVEIAVDVDQIKVLNDADSGADPGELNFVLALYTQDLTRSARHAVGPLTVSTGDLVGDAVSPGPVTLCLTEEQANAAIATVQSWDDDGGTAGDLNDGDQALRGPNASLALGSPGVQTVASADLEVTFDITDTPSDVDADGLTRCDEEMRGTNALAADTDHDQLNDGHEVAAGTDPLDPDTDDDSAYDGADNCPQVANADQADHESDGAGDACDADDDNDGLPDDADAFPQSDLRTTIFVGDCDAGVPNDHVFADGGNFNDRIAQCAANSTNHGELVSCVTLLVNEWQKSGLIDNQSKNPIMNCASKASD
jgi:hypothetical protein